MSKRILMASAVFAAGAAGVPFSAFEALAQSYPPPPGYSQQYGDRRAAPDFDILEDDDGPNGRGATALSPPGYQQQPNYQQQPQRPLTYEQQGYSGPILSPDDPRYGRPAGAQVAPAYSDRAPPQQGQPLPPYADRGPPPQNNMYQQDANRPLRPPGGIDGPTGAVQQSQPGQPQPGTATGANGRSVMSALPIEEQPETGPRKELPAHLRRAEVNFQTKEPAGTIVVDTQNTQLYFILGGGRAIRYGIRVGREGFTWNGVQKVTRKAEWPDWHPPTEMIERQPYLPRFMAGGDGNPLGARAMYLGNTVYRIHGTNQPSTIGQFVSSGCFGMLNEDVTDLFDRVKVGTRVVVLPGGKPADAPVTASAQQPVQLNNGPANAGGYTPSPSAVDQRPVASNAPYQGGVSQGGAPVGQGGAPVNAAPRPNVSMGVPNQGPTVVPPLPAPVVVR